MSIYTKVKYQQAFYDALSDFGGLIDWLLHFISIRTSIKDYFKREFVVLNIISKKKKMITSHIVNVKDDIAEIDGQVFVLKPFPRDFRCPNCGASPLSRCCIGREGGGPLHECVKCGRRD